MRLVDLRSDTVTRPTPGMLRAMMKAEVGDDVLGDDPTVKRLEELGAEFLGQEASLFFPSGTMANTVAYRSWTQPGDEIICDRRAHSYNLESAAGAALCGLSFYPIDTPDGILPVEAVEAAIRPHEYHRPVTRVVALENTHNLAGGTVYPLDRVRQLAELTKRRGLKLHMDGARLANAAVAFGVKAADYGRLCDSVTQCLSKGLGCPVGTLLAGPAEFIQRARRFRKMFGGGMRQAGYLAAAGIYALKHNVKRLAEDHARARRLANGLAGIKGIIVDLDLVQTNMVFFSLRAGPARVEELLASLKSQGILLSRPAPNRLRAVTHLDVNDSDIDRALKAISRCIR